MPRRTLNQKSFFNPELVCPTCLEPGTVPWLLARYRSTLMPSWLFKGWRGEGRRGRPAWPAVVLMTLILLRWWDGERSRRKACRRAETDATWRAAMGLEFGAPTPDEKTVREFERFLRRRHPDSDTPRYLLFHEHVARTCVRSGVLGSKPQWVTDSTPMWCYGAVLDTVRLLGEGLGMVARQWAEARRTSVEVIAKQWETPWVLAPSVKGAFAVDWRDPTARSAVLTELAEKVLQVVAEVRQGLEKTRRGKRKKLLKLCRNLLRVVDQNLERSGDGRLVVARRVAKGRIISLTDPQARHGRKSHSKTFNGFKLHVLGDLQSGLILALAVTPGNKHDNWPAPSVVRRAKRLYREMTTLLGDTAYGGARLRHLVRGTTGVSIVAPVPAGRPQPHTLGKGEFQPDLDRGICVCPRGVATDDLRFIRKDDGWAPRFRWPKDTCASCPFAKDCAATKPGGNPKLVFHPYEAELRANRELWEKPETRELYRLRSRGERLINETTRRGARKAAAWSIGSAVFQAYSIVAVSNLGVLARALAKKEIPIVIDRAA